MTILVCLTGCRELRRGKPVPLAGEAQLVDHGLISGQLMVSPQLDCSDDSSRSIGERAGVQLLTFSNSGDCSECDRHWFGLEKLSRDNALAVPPFIVSFASQAQRAEAALQYAAWSRQPVCFDESGVLWSRYNISHTPVTVLLSHGRILYLNDAPLVDSVAASQFRDTIAALAKREAGR
ncbi:MAG TPA: hypothetical protein VGM82_09385 [Gemmatimonadaceae bacterium]|jgi:hypothetical protein